MIPIQGDARSAEECPECEEKQVEDEESPKCCESRCKRYGIPSAKTKKKAQGNKVAGPEIRKRRKLNDFHKTETLVLACTIGPEMLIF